MARCCCWLTGIRTHRRTSARSAACIVAGALGDGEMHAKLHPVFWKGYRGKGSGYSHAASVGSLHAPFHVACHCACHVECDGVVILESTPPIAALVLEPEAAELVEHGVPNHA